MKVILTFVFNNRAIVLICLFLYLFYFYTYLLWFINNIIHSYFISFMPFF